MRSVRLHSAGRRLRDEIVPDPSPKAGEIVIEVRAAGICHSDAHYRSDPGRARLPVTPGHEVAGVIVASGPGVTGTFEGDRVGVHYLVSCGECPPCLRGGERFCARIEMFGKERDGGFAERIAVPAANAVPIPDEISFDHAAIMMCSTATALHALRLANLSAGEKVLVVGFGGLGFSAVQLAQTFGAGTVVVSDVVSEKLLAARALGAMTVDAEKNEPTPEVDIALDFVGSPAARTAALRALAPGGRLVLVALDDRPFAFDPYRDILGKERRIIGCSDHLYTELVELMELARTKRIDLSSAVTRAVPLDAEAINSVLDELESGTTQFRTVIRPNG